MEGSSATQIKSFFINGPAGRLEAVLNTGSERAAHAAVVCHPHPLYGGTMNNRVVFHTMKTLNDMGIPVLRFNFRDTGRSAGEHDYGHGEVDDVRAALNWLDAELRLPIIFAGFSFGAAVGLEASFNDSRVDALISIGTPIRIEDDDREYSYGYLGECQKPKLFISGAEDSFGPAESLRQISEFVPEPKQLTLIDGADHFFEGHLLELCQEIESWVKSTFPEG
jgi:alpha/beta superfamily hydrolase